MAQDIRLHSTLSKSFTAPQWVVSGALALAVAVAYFLSARLSLALLRVPDGVAVFWPAAGVSAGALIALGRGARWPVAVGAAAATIAANLLGDRDLWASIVFGACNAGEAILAAALIQNRFGENFDLDRVSHVIGLIAAAIAATVVSGIGGTFAFVQFYYSKGAVLGIWYHWFASDALGIVAIAPLLIGFASLGRRTPSRREVVDGTAALGLLAFVTGVGAFAPWEPWAVAVPIAFVFPLLLWLAARCAPFFSAAAAFIVSIATVTKTTIGIGVFLNPDISVNDHILAAQAGVLATSLCALVLAALFEERRRHAQTLDQHAQALEKSEERLRLALATGQIGMWEWNARTGTYFWNDENYRLFGYQVGEVEPNRDTWAARVHPEDREAAESSTVSAQRECREYINEYRVIHPDGRLRWVRARGRFLYQGNEPVRVIGLSEDVTEARQQIETQRVLVAELQHRTRNLMSVVQSIALQTLDSADSLADFQGRFNRRLEALSRVQGLLSRADNEPITLRALLLMEFESLGLDAFGKKIALFGGPEARLRKSAVEMLALATHELLTNAIKYGALASETGRLSVTWRIEGVPPDQQLVLEWIERGIAAPAPAANPKRHGYGRTLIEEALPYSLGAETSFELGADGLRCRISLPLTNEAEAAL